jgi:hypothetical protein
MEITDIVWFILVTIVLTFPIIFIKQYIVTKNFIYIVLAIIFYIILVFGYAKLFQKYYIYHMIPVWFISMVLVLLAGIFIFSEQIKIINIIGIILGLVAMYLIIK